MSKLILSDMPVGDIKSGDQVVLTEHGWAINSPDKDDVQLTHEYNSAGGFVDWIVAQTGYEKVGNKITGPGFPQGGIDIMELGHGNAILQRYDTIVGVGASITDGLFGSFQFDTPFRGVKFVSASAPGTTLQYMIDNITDFTSLVEGRTLFIIHAGGNDCSTLLSAGGALDDANGTVLDWNSVSEQHRTATLDRYQNLITQLSDVGDVALATLTLRDYKGLVLTNSNPDSIGSGSWNDNTTIPICEQLTPNFFDKGTGRPVFDYYNMVKDDPTILDVDNVHMSSDMLFPGGGGYPDGPNYNTMRNYMIDSLASVGLIDSTPFDSSVFRDRIILNVGIGNALTGRPPYQPYAVTQEIVGNTTYPNVDLTSFKHPVTSGGAKVTMDLSGGTAYGRNNLTTTSLPWNEGVVERNVLSTSAGSAPPMVFTFSGVGTSGVVTVCGLHTVGAADPARRALITLTDMNGDTTTEIENSNELLDVNNQPFVASIPYTLSDDTQNLVVSVQKAAGAAYGYVSGIQIDIDI